MLKRILLSITGFLVLGTSVGYADYEMGCDDPSYHAYIKQQLAKSDTKNKQLYSETLFDYNRSKSSTSNPYRRISDLARHLTYSAQYDSIEKVEANIAELLNLGASLQVDQQIAAATLDGFSYENHVVGIARAWVAYRQGDQQTAFNELLSSLEINNSSLMSAFGPDLYFVRHIYTDGHSEPVLSYLEKTEQFWTGKKADDMRYVWRTMINANCKLQFQFFDSIKALELGISIRDVNR